MSFICISFQQLLVFSLFCMIAIYTLIIICNFNITSLFFELSLVVYFSANLNAQVSLFLYFLYLLFDLLRLLIIKSWYYYIPFDIIISLFLFLCNFSKFEIRILIFLVNDSNIGYFFLLVYYFFYYKRKLSYATIY